MSPEVRKIQGGSRIQFLAISAAVLFASSGCPRDTGKETGPADTTPDTGNPADADGDGYTTDGGDCDDTDPAVHPGATETWYDGVDQDCSGGSDYDADTDGHDSAAFGGDDCDDANPAVFFGATETWYDGGDQDCSGGSDFDADADGHDSASYEGDDCDDANAAVYPEAQEMCQDGIDQDCDGSDPACPDMGEVDLGDPGILEFMGEHASDDAGNSVAGAGDVDGDGFDDVLVAALSSGGYSLAGAVYLLRGPVTASQDLSNAHATFVGEGLTDEVGFGNPGVAGVGDLDADGFDDIVIGSNGYNNWAGAAYLQMGPITTGGSLPTLADVTLTGGTNDHAGYSIAGGGDVDGDGYQDILIGAPGMDARTGGAYLVRGPIAGDSDLSLSDVILRGEDVGDIAGQPVAIAGDVDGDGFDDILIGAESHNSFTGATYLLLGPVTADRELAMADAKLAGTARHDHAGSSVTGAGDLNGDGLADILIGAPGSSEDRGTAYVLYGPVTSDSNLSSADAALQGSSDDTWGDLAGRSVAAAGDVDGDGLGDILVGASGNDDGTGAAYLMYGPVTASQDLTVAGTMLVGEEMFSEYGPGQVGYSVAGAGDVDGDTHDDILIGAPSNNDNGVCAGAAYLVLFPDLP